MRSYAESTCSLDGLYARKVASVAFVSKMAVGRVIFIVETLSLCRLN